MAIDDLIFVSFWQNVVAMNRDTGEIVWLHKLKHGGYVTVMLDGDRLIVSNSAYMDCLNAFDGRLMWHNPLKGLISGVASMASVRGRTSHVSALQVSAFSGESE